MFVVKLKTAYEMRSSDWSSDVCSSDLQAELDIGGAGGIRVCNGADHKLDLRCCRTRFRPGRSRRQPESDAHSATISNHRPNPAQHDTRDLAVVPGAMVARSMIGSFTEMAPSISTRWVPRPRIQKV